MSIDYYTIQEHLKEELMKESDPQKKLLLAQALEIAKRAGESDVKYERENQTLKANGWKQFWATILAAGIAGGLTMATKLIFQKNSHEYEIEGIRPGYRSQTDKQV